ncbi:hypothetical protein [Salinigranum sp.]|uniref:hypothetical protein n=1 Tax=Salinigranum sp. TaxID=1966351 RepID=UPI0035634894
MDRSAPGTGTGTGSGRRLTIEAVPTTRSAITSDVARPLSGFSDADARESSRLRSAETTYLSLGDYYYRVDRLGENTVTERDYQDTATAVAASDEEFETVVDERVVTHLDPTALSAAVEETFRTVLERGQVSWGEPVPPGPEALATQLDDERYVEWEGEYVAVEVRELVA